MKINNNLENQFRKKLNKRTIQPSDKAWDRLDAMLAVSEKKKSKKGGFWIAATLAVFATLGSLFLTTNKSEIIPTEDFVVRKNHNQRIIIDPIQLWMEEEDFVVTEKELVKKPIPQNNIQTRKKTDVHNNTIYDHVKNKNTEMTMTDVDIEIVSHTASESNTYITAQDLLNSIIDEKNIAEQNNKPAVTIDHKSLLYQAEMEVEQQYRKNAIDRFLQKSYDNVRVATLNKF